MPLGFLTCGDRVEGFYARAKGVRVDNRMRMARFDGSVQVGRVDRNGLEV